jgi:penicillin-binding protein 2
VIGKTGTAQNTGKGDTSWFVGVLNAENDPARPQYVVVAMVEEGGFGADVAAPIVRRVIDHLNGDPNPAPVQVAPKNPNRREDQGD